MIAMAEQTITRRDFVAGASAAAVTVGLAGGLSGCSSDEGEPSGSTTEDRWVPTTCNMCFNQCSIKAHVVDGVVVELYLAS